MNRTRSHRAEGGGLPSAVRRGAPRARTTLGGVAILMVPAVLQGDAAARPDPGEADPIEDVGSMRGPWSGDVFRDVRIGAEKRFVGPDGRTYATSQDVVEADAAKVDPLRLVLTGDLADVARDPGRAAERLTVILLFRDQPLHDAGEAARRRHGPEIAAATERNRAILARIAALRTVRPAPGGDRVRVEDVLAEEARLLTDAEKDELRRNRDLVLAHLAAMRREALADAAPAVEDDQAAVRAFLTAVPGVTVVSHAVVLNCLTATVPAGVLLRLVGEFPEIARIDRDGEVFPNLSVAVAAIGADNWWKANYLGSSSTPVAVLDCGVDSGHPALSGRVSKNAVFHKAAKTSTYYNDSSTNPDDLYGHGTHVAGCVASSDSTDRGPAYGATILNAKIAYLRTTGQASAFNSDILEGADWAGTQGAAVMDLSYGAYTSPNDASQATSLCFDAVVSGLGIPVALSTGNEGPTSGRTAVPGDAFNVLSVGDYDDNGSASSSDDFYDSYSSRGPTQDGRRKPDLCAPGVKISSCSHSWEGSSPDFVEATGTSFSAPLAAAACALVLDSGVAATPEGVKALLLGSAAHSSPYGTTPDTRWGWGALDLGRAYSFRASVAEGTFGSSTQRIFLKTGALPSGGRVTLAWNRHVTPNGSSTVTTYYKLTDFDLVLWDGGTNATLGSSTSSVDPVEQVEVASAVQSPVVEIRINGSFPSGVSSDTWGFAAESSGQTTAASLPSISCGFGDTVAGVLPGETFTAKVSVANGGGLTAFAPQVTLTVPAGYSIVAGANPATAAAVAPGSSATVSWTVQAPMTPGKVSLSAKATSSSFGQTVNAPSATMTFAVDVDTPTGSIDVPPFTNLAAVPATFSTSDASTYVASVRVRDSAAEWGPWEVYTGTSAVPLTPGDGARTVQAEFRDVVGHVSATASDSVVVDTALPTASILLNAGEAWTNKVSVPVALTADDATSGIAKMRFSLDGVNWRPWRAFAAATTEPLAAANGLQTLHAQVMDGAGNVSAAASDTITLDTVVAAGTAELLGGSAYSHPGRPLSADVRPIGADLSGIADVRTSTDGGASWSEWQPVTAAPVEVPVPPGTSDGDLVVSFQLRDRAGNVSSRFSDAIYGFSLSPRDASSAPSIRGSISAGEDLDVYRLDLVAGETVSVKVTAKSRKKKGDVRLELDLLDASGATLVTGRFPDTATKPGVTKFPAPAAGPYWLVVRATGADAAAGATYTLRLTTAIPRSALRPAGTSADEPGVGTSVSFGAARGWKVSGTLPAPLSGTPVLVAPDGTETPIPAKSVRAAGVGRVRLAPTLLPDGAGTWRIVVPGAAPAAYSLVLVPPKRKRGVVEAAGQ